MIFKMKDYKKYSISYLWICVTFIWASLISSAVWSWGSLLSFYGYHPLANNLHRLYALAVIFLLWVTGILYYLTVKKKSILSETAAADIEPTQPDIATDTDTEHFFAKHKVKLGNKKKGLFLIMQLGEANPSPLIPQIIRLAPCGQLIASEFDRRGQAGWAEFTSAIYAECCSTIRSADQKLSALWTDLISQCARRITTLPVNSLIITTDYATITNEQQWQNVQAAIMDMTKQLHHRLGYVPPVYFLLKDAQTISGFSEYFQSVSDLQNHALLGITIPVTAKIDAAAYEAMLARGFKTLQKDIEAQIAEKLNRFSGQHEPHALFRFPARFADFLNQYKQRLEQLALFLSGIGGLPPRAAAIACCTTDHVRFLKSFLLYVHNDTATAEHIAAIRQRRRKRRTGLVLASLLIIGLSAGVWTYIFWQSREYLAAFSAKLSATDAALSDMNKHPQKSFSLTSVVTPLLMTRQLMDEQNTNLLRRMAVGSDLRRSLIETHDQLADKYLLPQIVQQLETELRITGTNYSSRNHLFDALALYLSLAGRLVLSEQDLQQLTQNVFKTLGQDYAQNDQMMREIKDLFRAGRVPIRPDNALIEQAQLQLTDLSQASRALYLLEQYSQAAGLSPWQASEIIGPDADDIISFRRPETSQYRIPGLYTKSGFDTIIIPRFSDAIQSVIKTEKVWSKIRPADPSTLAQDVLTTYSTHFYQRWTEYLLNISINPPEVTVVSNQQGMQIRGTYKAPLLKLLSNIAEQTALIPFDTKVSSDLELANNRSSWKDKLPFASLRAFLKNNKTTGTELPLSDQLFSILSGIEKLQARLDTADSTSDGSADLETKLLEQYRRLQELTPELPFPLRPWMEQFSENAKPTLGTAIKKSLGNLWDKQNYGICKMLTTNRYPFQQNTSDEIALEDFTRLFGPDGIFAHFTNEALQPYVDTKSLPWRWRKSSARFLNKASLDMFEKADLIRRSFFQADQKMPSFTVKIRAQKLPDNIAIAIMQIGDTSVSASAQQNDTVSVSGPVSNNENSSKVLIFTDKWHEIASADGPWSLFRLLDQGKVTQITDGQYRVSFAAQGKSVSFLLDFSALYPAYNKALLETFRCTTLN